MIHQVSLANAFNDYDPFERPPTPPDSPLREHFCPKQVAHLNHIAPPPPGIEAANDDHHTAIGIVRSFKPPVPPKPRGLEFVAPLLSARNHTDIDIGAATEVRVSTPTRLLARHEACLRDPEFCLCTEHPTAAAAAAAEQQQSHQTCGHRHETLYKREMRDGVPVETLTHVCEIRHLGEAEVEAERMDLSEEEEEEEEEEGGMILR
ncbi:hypothetical protein ABEF95_013290 [Exophiala dermatitidis]